ncbi:50S ribosomal protein L4 [Propylenella binzhouense]|uniref:Large ribosomal subunit protein uL4 n=1 Tax=Propylenella binzhouense TaxID=2555902 RepID=A0A964T1P9_9HYPH|nr:50S ribosomal protein L4 [Propylenella binzhouense]MYZ46629.1 50S ribosomal protein L4 [Propylenella binzhouense]
MEFEVKTLDGQSAGSITVSEALFGLEPRADILQRMVRYQLAKRQQGTHKSKGRSEVKATSKKVYRQKGTGSARHGNKAAPQFRGGGKAFGPVARSHAIDLPKKVRALALKHALSAKARADAIIVVDDLTSADGKTKALAARFGGLGIANALVIGGSEIDAGFGRAARNIPQLDVLPVQGINVYDILRRDRLVLSRAAIEALEERFK